ncbi:hypothetical protein BH20GEM2_BH20GEM2_03860 [soil metagenome]
MRLLRAALITILAIVIGGCTAFDAFGSERATHQQGSDEIVQGQVRVTLGVAPEVIDAPGTVVARLTYENLGSETVVLGSAYGCLSFASVYRGEDRIPFPATQYACTAAASYRDLEPGAPLTVQWPLVVGGANGMHLPAGTYRFVAELNTHTENLERTFVVR